LLLLHSKFRTRAVRVAKTLYVARLVLIAHER
jgi:hypothetical protein